MFSKVNSNSRSASSRKYDEEAELPLRTFLKEQLEDKAISSLEDIEAQYNNYVPIFLDQYCQNNDALTDLELRLATQRVIIIHIRYKTLD